MLFRSNSRHYCCYFASYYNKLRSRSLSTSCRHFKFMKWSYSHGVSMTPLLNTTIAEVFWNSTEKCPDRDLFVFPQDNVRKTYSEVLHDAKKFASGLLALGLNKGDRVGMWGPNTYEWTLTQFGTALAGMILVTVNPAFRVREFEYVMKKVGISALVSSSHFKTQDYFEMIAETCPQLTSSKPGSLQRTRLPDLKHVIMLGEEKQNGAWSFADIMQAGDSKSDEALNQLMEDLQPDEPINIQFTSGTTGLPKGSTLSHFNIVNNAYFMGLRGEFHKEKTIIVCPPPLYHCYGCVLGSLGSMVHKATVVFPSQGFDPLAVLKAIHNEKGTCLYGTPTMFIDVLNHPDFDKYDYSSITKGTMAGAPCPIELCKQVREKLHMKQLMIMYGSTEMSPLSFATLPSDPIEVQTETVGRVMDHAEAKIVDQDGKLCPVNQKGELLTRGYMIMLGYWNDDEKTKEIFGSDRWYKSGDLATMDEEGLVKIIGRTKDMIIRGGENIYPTEIEQFLYTHPKIEEVQVVGVPSRRMGEEVCAWIKLRHGENATEDEIKKFCKGQIAHFKIPKYIMFKEKEDFPMTITGKIQKFKIREISKRELNLETV